MGHEESGTGAHLGSAQTLTSGGAIGATLGTLGFFLLSTLVFGFLDRRHLPGGLFKKYDNDLYLAARNTQGSVSLMFSFFASGAGAWIMFAVPEAAILGGPIALIGYTLSAIVPLFIFLFIAPTLRRVLPHGITFFEFVQARYGWFANLYVSLIALLYMFLYLSAEFTAVGDAVASFVRSDAAKLTAIAGTSVITVVYTSIGGLPVSLMTDRVQVCVPSPCPRAEPSPSPSHDRPTACRASA